MDGVDDARIEPLFQQPVDRGRIEPQVFAEPLFDRQFAQRRLEVRQQFPQHEQNLRFRLDIRVVEQRRSVARGAGTREENVGAKGCVRTRPGASNRPLQGCFR